jgi:hypothetical protein
MFYPKNLFFIFLFCSSSLFAQTPLLKTHHLFKINPINSFTFKGDFRQRIDIIRHQDETNRHMNRMRLRALFSINIYSDLKFSVGLASGGKNPVSSNQIFDNGFSTKDLRLDLAFFNFKLTDSSSLIGGKMKNPFYKVGQNSLFWDADLNPEGFALQIKKEHLTATLVSFIVDERKKSNDSYLFGGQIKYEYPLSPQSSWITGGGYYYYSHLKGFPPLFDQKSRGNSIDQYGDYLYEYHITEIFLEYKTQWKKHPIALYSNFFKNNAIHTINTASIYGIRLGGLKFSGDWRIGLAYLKNDSDPFVSLFNDSDFAGGNTHAKGFLFKAGYVLKSNVILKLTYIDSSIASTASFQRKKLNELNDYNRLQLDINVYF